MTWHANRAGNTYLDEERLQRIAEERGWILSKVGEKPEVVVFRFRPLEAEA